MLESLTVDNFRGIRHLDLENLGRVNIFVGKNASGKTSILEAASIAGNPTSPRWLAQLGVWRELPAPTLQSPDAISIAFPEMNIRKRISFRFSVRGIKQSLDITALDEASLSQRPVHTVTEAPASSSSEIADIGRFFGVNYIYSPSEGKVIESRMELFSEGSAQKREPAVDKMGAFYIHARRSTSARETASVLTRLFEKKLQEPFMQAIRKVDPRVITMQPGLRGNNPVILVDIDLPSLIPMNALGDGFCRVCLMLTGMVAENSSLVIVDEIDSGLHHT